MTTAVNPRLRVLQALRSKERQRISVADLVKATGLTEELVRNNRVNLEGSGFIVGFRKSETDVSFSITDTGKVHAAYLESRR